MKIAIIVIASLLIGFGSAWFWFGDTEAQQTDMVEGETQLYTCGMHPEVISTEPGLCPICHMKLIPKRDAKDNAGGVSIDPVTRQNMGLTTAAVKQQTLSKRVRAFGRVTVADPSVHNVTLKIPGWVEKLYVNEEGERVAKGQPLLEIYSPELVTAQREYLAAVNNAGNTDNLQRFVQMTENRMRNWDITEDQLTRLRETAEISRTMLIRTPADGFVIRKHVEAGDKVGSNTILYEVADLSRVWIKAYVYEKDLPYLRLGQEAAVSTPGLPGKKFLSRVIYISPALNPQGQVEIRLELKNHDFALRPEMYANVDLEHRVLHERLTVPRSAVINSGTKQIVYIASTGDTFEPRTITTGLVDEDDMIEIVSGLSGNEDVVTSGQFLLDSEARLNEAAGVTAGHVHGAGAVSDDTESEKHPTGSDSIAEKDTSKTEHDGHAETGDRATSSDPHDIHTCPMPSHYHVLNYGPGECPECGMKLVPVARTDNKSVYVCPMPEHRVVQPDSGRCPVCNMNLVKYEPGEGDAQ